MQASTHVAAGKLVGCAAFGTPTGREVEAQTGVAVPHQDDWVEQASYALRFDPEHDTLVMQRIQLPSATVLWFGLFRQAYEINFNRNGGFVGFCVWTVNQRLDGAKLLRALTLAAEEVRAKAVTGGKFHTSIHAVSRQLTGDAASYADMLTSAQDLPSTLAGGTARPTIAPMVLDVQGCSDAWCAQLVDLFQSEPGFQGYSALALARSSAVVESAKTLRLWPVVSPVEWLMTPSRAIANGLQTQLQAAQALALQREQDATHLAQRLENEQAGHRQQCQTLEQQLMLVKENALQIELKARVDAERASSEFDKWADRTARAEKQSKDSAQEVASVRIQLQDLKKIQTHAQSPITGQPALSPSTSYASRPEAGNLQTMVIQSLRQRIHSESSRFIELQDAYKELDAEKAHLYSRVQMLERERSFSSTVDSENENDNVNLLSAGARRSVPLWVHVICWIGWIGFFATSTMHYFGTRTAQELFGRGKPVSLDRVHSLEDQVVSLRQKLDTAIELATSLENEITSLRMEKAAMIQPKLPAKPARMSAPIEY